MGPDLGALTVCVVTFERAAFLRRCLEALHSATAGAVQVVVVDASARSARDIAESAFPGAVYVHAPALAGWMTRSRNEALKWARGDIISFIDDDVVVSDGWADAVLRAFDDPDVAAVGGRTRNGAEGEEHYPLPIGRLRDDGTLTDGFAADADEIVRIDHGIGANMSFRRAVLGELGGFRDDYPGTALREDTDMFLRVRAWGGRAVFAPDAVVDHRPAPHVRGARFDTRYKLYGRRNHVVLLARDQGLGAPMLRRWIGGQLRAVGAASGGAAVVRRLAVTLAGIGWGLGAAAFDAKWRPLSPVRQGPDAEALRQRLSRPALRRSKTLDPREEPTFALVIPTHRRPEFVRQAIDSAIRQTRPFDQIIVVADGVDDPVLRESTPSGVEVIGIPRSGAAAARNEGIARARTEWVCFLDDDDLLHPDYLARICEEVAATPDVCALNTSFWSFAAHAGPGDEFSAENLDECLREAATAVPKNDHGYLEIEGRSFDLLLERLRGSMSTAAVRRDVLIEVGGFPTGAVTAEDWTMYVNVARLAEWRYVSSRLAFFRDHPSTTTRAGTAHMGVTALRSIQAFWQPSPLPTPPHRPLDAYRGHYRHVLRWTLSACRRERDLRRYVQALRVARSILPHRLDIVRAATPDRLRRPMLRARRE